MWLRERVRERVVREGGERGGRGRAREREREEREREREFFRFNGRDIKSPRPIMAEKSSLLLKNERSRKQVTLTVCVHLCFLLLGSTRTANQRNQFCLFVWCCKIFPLYNIIDVLKIGVVIFMLLWISVRLDNELNFSLDIY